MKIQETLNISVNQFSAHILKSIQYDLKEYGKLSVDLDHIRKGLKYKKQMSTKMKQTDNVDVEITKLDMDPFIYEVTFDSTQGKTVMSYSAKAIADNKCEVIYLEEFIGKNTMNKLNHKLMSVFYTGRSKKKVHYLLKAIEEYVLKGE
ncbi:DUF3284 domain-containing protein [Anaerorhabdus sp.]|jgi:hypothetical protein|uniref:DUF3284 domain-containing protein n=1 Tax=Anaerorhabdus sp. TaxID=1872524 RepID=UPI002FCC0B90